MDFSHPTYLQIFLTASLPIMGLAYALVGGLKLSLVDRLQIDEGKVGRLVGGFGTMFGPTILLCGFLTDAVGRKGVWLAGSAAVAVSILVLVRTRTYRSALVAVVLLGIGWEDQHPGRLPRRRRVRRGLPDVDCDQIDASHSRNTTAKPGGC